MKATPLLCAALLLVSGCATRDYQIPSQGILSESQIEENFRIDREWWKQYHDPSLDSLVAMGAQIILCDPHRVVVVGKSQLYGTRLESPDVRAGMSLLIAALTAQGQSTIYNVRQIDRGYERVDEKLRALGAKIEREHID